MKTKALLFVCALVMFSALFNQLKAQVDKNDSLALVDLFKSTDGANWNNHKNWLTKKPVSTWYGVELDTSNRIDYLYLAYNSLTGTLPSSLCHLTKVNFLDLSDNLISGGIPDSIGNLTAVQTLNLGDNPLTGTLPASLGDCRSMQYLQIYNTQISGPIPASLNNMVSLYNIELSNNLLSGTIPPINNLISLSIAHLNNNRLTGRLPSLEGLTALINFNVSNNQLTQTTNYNPHKKFPNLQLDVSNNNFTFNGLEYAAAYVYEPTYSPQATLTLHQANGKLSVNAGGTLQNNTYRWVRVGGGSVLIPGDSTFQVTVSGQYYAQIMNSVAKQLTLMTDTISCRVSQAEGRPAAMPISIYPNPVKNILYVRGLDKNNILRVNIADAMGVVKLSTTVSYQSEMQYDVSRLKPGAYVLTVVHGITKISEHFMKE